MSRDNAEGVDIRARGYQAHPIRTKGIQPSSDFVDPVLGYVFLQADVFHPFVK